MKKIAVLVAPGFEEGETLTIVDILRRAGFQCKTFGFEKEVEGAHSIVIVCDEVLSDEVVNYDMVVLPGGRPGADNLAASEEVMKILKTMDQNPNQYVCAMCAAPRALQNAGLLKNRNYTAFTGYGDILPDGNYKEDIVVQDGHMITSRAPGTTYAFAYYLVDVLGGDSEKIKQRMAYYDAFGGGMHA